MKHTTSMLMGILLAFGAGIAGASSLAGTWIMNPEKSSFTGPSFKTQTRTYTEAADGSITMSFSGAGADGSPVTGGGTFKYDGNDYPITGSKDYDTTSLKKVNRATTKFKLKSGGKLVGHGTRTISAYGKALTLTSSVTRADGNQYTSKMVFDKQ
jgi:hypothetical protein